LGPSAALLGDFKHSMSRRTSIAIHLILALLIGAPLHYYCGNEDMRDERFAWRMFSPTRIEKCGTQFLLGEDRKPYRASQMFHTAWVGLAQRGRQQVIEAMGHRICEKNPEQELHIRVQCETRPGSSASKPGTLFDPNRSESDDDVELISRGLFDFCKTGEL